MRRTPIWTAIAPLVLLLAGGVAAAREAPRPNILIIFTDDQGYADLGSTGSPTNRTPRMDQLAQDGTRFTSFYAQSVCGPSRSALLTGRYPMRSKGWSMPASEITWAELLKTVGYQTACIGKWDVSNRKAIVERMPNAKGFDYYFGTLGANDNGSVAFHENNEAAGDTRDMASLTRLYTDKAIDFLRSKRDKDRPFALYVAHTMMHTIIDASPRFKGKSKGSLYGDVVEEFDYETGRLLDVVDELGLRESTLVIYTADNGPWNQPAYTERKKGHPEGSIFWGNAGPLRDGKGSCYEGGYRVPCIVRWPGKVPAGVASDAIFATIDFLPTFANLAGFKVPEDRVIDGVDQTDLLFGKTPKGARTTFVYLNNAIRQGKWKYVRAEHEVPGYALDRERERVEELYDLEEDIGERKNLAAEHPEKARELRDLLDGYASAEAPDAESLNALSEEERKAGWRLLFDGRTLEGWRGYRSKDLPTSWKVESGSLLSRPAKDETRGDIITVEQFGDFELVLDWKMTRGNNSGVIYRATEEYANVWESGPEFQILDNAGHLDGLNPLASAGACYAVYAPLKDVTRPIGQWNTARILARGKHVEHWLNGEKLLEYDVGSDRWQAHVKTSKFFETAYGRGTWGLAPKGYIGLQDYGGAIEYRNIKIRPAATRE